jgi:hypothetical protein
VTCRAVACYLGAYLLRDLLLHLLVSVLLSTPISTLLSLVVQTFSFPLLDSLLIYLCLLADLFSAHSSTSLALPTILAIAQFCIVLFDSLLDDRRFDL